MLCSNFVRITYPPLFVNCFFSRFFNFFSAARRALTSATALLEYQSYFQKSTPFLPVCTLFCSLFLFPPSFSHFHFYGLIYLILDISHSYKCIVFFKALSSFLPVSAVFRIFQITKHEAYAAIHSSKQRIQPFFRSLHPLSADPFHDDTYRG